MAGSTAMITCISGMNSGFAFSEMYIDWYDVKATLSAESLSLKSMLKQELPSTVELVPLISAFVLILLKNSANSMIFKGLE
jgi:hypothetical protein